MGIKGLTKFLADNAPKAMRHQEINAFMGRIVVIDASMSLYQFMVAIRDAESYGTLTNEAGEATSHIAGMLSRVVRLLEHGVKPVYVFDGKPPTLKGGELAKRGERRAAAEASLAEAKEKGDMAEVKKMMGRVVKVTKQHNEDIKRLLRILGVPVVEAPCEAEAQCAVLAAAGLAYATATEDADALAFGTPVLIRHLTFSEAKAKANPALQIDLEVALTELGLDMPQFVDFCIMCGCDYTDTIRGIGPATAFRLIKQYGSIENVLENIDTEKHPPPENFNYKEARNFFLSPEVTDSADVELKWTEPDFEGLRRYLIDENQFGTQRVENLIARMQKAKAKGAQTRLENFFGSTTVKSSTEIKAKEEKRGTKRKSAAGGGNKRAKVK